MLQPNSKSFLLHVYALNCDFLVTKDNITSSLLKLTCSPKKSSYFYFIGVKYKVIDLLPLWSFCVWLGAEEHSREWRPARRVCPCSMNIYVYPALPQLKKKCASICMETSNKSLRPTHATQLQIGRKPARWSLFRSSQQVTPHCRPRPEYFILPAGAPCHCRPIFSPLLQERILWHMAVECEPNKRFLLKENFHLWIFLDLLIVCFYI